jgi:FkbM family methyltransferase
MIKGRWLVSLLQRVVDGSVSLTEAFAFIGWRLGRSKGPIEIEGMLFEDVDRTTWGLIAMILIEREYTPAGYEVRLDHNVVDIGAHKGVFVGFAARRTRGLILAIEPDPNNFRALQKFVETNGYRNVELVNAAVAAESGKARLFRSGTSSRHTLIGVDQKSGEALDESIIVAAFSLDDILARFEVVNFLKMDCEGAEYPILMSCSHRTLSKIQHLVAELHGLDIDNRARLIQERVASSFSEVSIRKTSPGMGLLFGRKP